ncbi:MAG: hypothetical protein H6R17_4274 [Proteobacteria bacterium]|nr:hypothetical protein [Pseudomonadota bacterium]
MHPLRQMRHPNRPLIGYAGQRGVVLLIALIVLVALTLAGVALIRSVDTTNLIAGNMSFQQSAIQSGEKSTEDAVAWLLTSSTSDLNNDNATNGFRAQRADPATGVSWDAFWTATLAAQAKTLPQDVAGNTVSYVIHRLCDGVGPTSTVNCSLSLEKPRDSKGDPTAFPETKTYYRITTRIAGPRRTVAYIQTIVTR